MNSQVLVRPFDPLPVRNAPTDGCSAACNEIEVIRLHVARELTPG
jgi:hypothetical protein